MKLYDICGLGNGIVDILVEVSDDQFRTLDLERSSYGMLSDQEQRELLAKLPQVTPLLTSGGSVANSVIAVSQLGGKGAFLCCLGDDRYGLFYENEFNALGIEVGNPINVGQQTGTCVVCVTPDAERTLRTNLGVAARLSEQRVRESAEVIKNSRWLFIEGYVFANPQVGTAAIECAIQLARANDCRVALTFSDEFIVHTCGDNLREAVAKADLIFANEKEACAFTGEATFQSAFSALKEIVPSAIVTAGPNGALVRFAGQDHQVSAFPCKPVDLTGAGDMLAGSFLFGITHEYTPEIAVRAGCYMAMQVITRYGARLHSGTREHWQAALSHL